MGAPPDALLREWTKIECAREYITSHPRASRKVPRCFVAEPPPPPPPPPPPNDWRMKLVNFIIFHGVARCLRTLLLHLVHYLASPRRVRSWWKLSINEKIYPNRWNPFILTLEICKLFVTFVNLFTLNFIQFNSLDLHFTDKGSSRDKEYVAESLETVIGLFVIGIKG